MMSRLMRCSASLFKLSLPIQSSGWNVRSSPNQWDSELKGLDWALAQLCTPEIKTEDVKMKDDGGVHEDNEKSSIQDERLDEKEDTEKGDAKTLNESLPAPSLCVTLASRVTPPSVGIHQADDNYHSSDDECNHVLHDDIISVINDFVSLIGLYFAIWIRFGVSRTPLEHLLGTTVNRSKSQDIIKSSSPLFSGNDLICPNIGDQFILKKSVYIQQLQFLKVRDSQLFRHPCTQ